MTVKTDKVGHPLLTLSSKNAGPYVILFGLADPRFYFMIPFQIALSRWRGLPG
jgi:hypothetical protein